MVVDSGAAQMGKTVLETSRKTVDQSAMQVSLSKIQNPNNVEKKRREVDPWTQEGYEGGGLEPTGKVKK